MQQSLTSRLLARPLALGLAALLVHPLQAAPPVQLNLLIVEGEGAINNIKQRTAREPVVQVEDENHKPVAGAAVIFTLPGSGAGGTFPGGATVLRTTTDQQGRAVARGLRVNKVQGKYQIQVEASFQNLTAHAVINQANAMLTAAAVGISAKTIAILLAIGGAAAAGATIAATRNGGSTPAAPPTVVTPGTPTVGPPR